MTLQTFCIELGNSLVFSANNKKSVCYSLNHHLYKFITIVKFVPTAHGTTDNKKNSVALVRERTIPTERPPPVGEVSANFCG